MTTCESDKTLYYFGIGIMIIALIYCYWLCTVPTEPDAISNNIIVVPITLLFGLFVTIISKLQ